MIIAATGHRPHKLGGYAARHRRVLIELATNYLAWRKPDEVVTGMAQGWDQAVGCAAIKLGIPLTCAIPFKGQESRWPKESQEMFWKIVDASQRVVYVSEGGYEHYKMQVRNEWMVDNSEELLALWDGTDGGTGNCIRYARSKGRTIYNLWDYFSGQSDVHDLIL